MKKLLLQLDTDKFASTFDAVTAYEAGVNNVMSYGGVAPEDVRGLLQGIMFTRPRSDLHQTAVFIGGRRIDVCEQILEAARATMFPPYCLSVMLDSNGCNTASAAAVALIEPNLKLKGARVVVLGGFGPVGLRAARLMAGEGAQVVVTGLPRELFPWQWDEARARHDVKLAHDQAREFDFSIQVARNRAEMLRALDGAQVAMAVGPAGVQLISQQDWLSRPNLKVLADLNVTPPLGIEGLETHWHGHQADGRLFFGGLGIGHAKMRLHKAAIMSLFESERVLDAEEIYALAKTLLPSPHAELVPA